MDQIIAQGSFQSRELINICGISVKWLSSNPGTFSGILIKVFESGLRIRICVPHVALVFKDGQKTYNWISRFSINSPMKTRNGTIWFEARLLGFGFIIKHVAD